MSAAIAKARVGTTLKGKWHLDAILGQGGMATVYAATHRNGKRVAIKMLHPELAAMPELVTRFLREGYVANKVDHPGAVSILDDDATDEGLVYLVMELLDGAPLDRVLERAGGTLPCSYVLAVVDRVLDVLSAAHAKGIVHRDLKPENVFVLRDEGGADPMSWTGAPPIVKVLDFGIARLLELATPSTGGTRAGTILGTPGYMPPEQARGRWEIVGPRTDVWAVGAMMWTLLTGQTLHAAGTPNESLLRAMTEEIPPLRSIAPAVPAAVAEAVDRALAYDVDGRWPDAAAMQQALRAAASATPQTLVVASRPSPAPSASLAPSVSLASTGEVAITTAAITRRRAPVALVAIAGGALAAIAVGIGAFYLSRPGSPPPSVEPARVSASATPASLEASTLAPLPGESPSAGATVETQPAPSAEPAASTAPAASVRSIAVRKVPAPLSPAAPVAPATAVDPKSTAPIRDPLGSRR